MDQSAHKDDGCQPLELILAARGLKNMNNIFISDTMCTVYKSKGSHLVL
jgi:hypothetical protein